MLTTVWSKNIFFYEILRNWLLVSVRSMNLHGKLVVWRMCRQPNPWFKKKKKSYCCVSNILSQFCKTEETDSFVLYKFPMHTQDKQFSKTYGFTVRRLLQSNNILSKYWTIWLMKYFFLNTALNKCILWNIWVE